VKFEKKLLLPFAIACGYSVFFLSAKMPPPLLRPNEDRCANFEERDTPQGHIKTGEMRI
jgi:hypothetical protein